MLSKDIQKCMYIRNLVFFQILNVLPAENRQFPKKYFIKKLK